MTAIPAGPGDVLAVYGGGLAGDIIRIGETILNKGGNSAHVVVVTHQDVKGRWMGIQGQPGGVGLVDCTSFLNDSRTRSNHAQPRAAGDDQETVFLAACAKSLGIGYDWVGIAEDADEVLHVPDLSAELNRLWAWPANKNVLPGHVVCSSLAAMLYDLPAVNWAHPDLGTERVCMPGDWWMWSDNQQWKTAAPKAA